MGYTIYPSGSFFAYFLFKESRKFEIYPLILGKAEVGDTALGITPIFLDLDPEV